jgi:hypothetical protein
MTALMEIRGESFVDLASYLHPERTGVESYYAYRRMQRRKRA